MLGSFSGIKVVVVTKGDVKTLEQPAKAIARWITQFPTQFPKGSEQGIYLTQAMTTGPASKPQVSVQITSATVTAALPKSFARLESS